MDYVAAKSDDLLTTEVCEGDIPAGYEGVDIGPKTNELFKQEIKKAATVIWNGPVGWFEQAAFARGTQFVAEAMASSGSVTVVGGGETAEAVEQFGYDAQMTHVLDRRRGPSLPMSKARSSSRWPKSMTRESGVGSGVPGLAPADHTPPAGGTTRFPDTRYPMTERPKRGIPEGLWVKCPQCKATVFKKEVAGKLNCCPECDHHFAASARERLDQLLDADTFEEWDAELRPSDPLGFVDTKAYPDRLVAEQKKTGMPDAAVCGRGFIRGRGVVLGSTDFPVHGRQHGQRGRREADPRRRAGAGTASAVGVRQRQRRRGADAGGDSVPHADGESVGGPSAGTRRPAGCTCAC